MPKSKLVDDIVIIIDKPCWNKTLTKWEDFIRPAVLETLSQAKWVHDAEINILLTDDAAIQELNKNFRGINKPTNVLAFPSLEPSEILSLIKKINVTESIVLGDVILAYETLMQEAIQQNKSFQDHLIHLVVHGVLHLLGFDHEKDENAAIMESLEIRILSKFDIRNPYEV
jgi:probable rRNA maturation factor